MEEDSFPIRLLKSLGKQKLEKELKRLRMEEEVSVKISLENRFKEALRKAKEVREYVNERNNGCEPDIAECLAYDMQYVEKYVKQLEEENKELLEVRVSANAHNRIMELEKEKEEYRIGWCNKGEELEEYKKNSISKSKVKEKIEELDKRIKSNVTEDEYKNLRIYTCKDFNEFITSVLQELLREE